MSRSLVLIIAAALLASCAAQPAAIAPTPLPPTEAPTAAPPTLAPPTAAPPTQAPPTATPVPATAEPATATPAPPTPRPEPSPPVRMLIPEIGLDRELLSVGLDENRVPVVPNHDVGWYNLSASPGQGENVVLWGHVLRFKSTPNVPAPFARVKELAVGAALTLYSEDGRAHPYVVVEQVYATPDQVKFILPQGRELLTLVSCIGDKVVVDASVEMTHRLITIAAPAE
jgi:sortase (surface protein transpeptidase)